MNYPREAIGEYSIRVKDLNQTFVGKNFGLDLNGYVLFGKIGAIRVYERHVLLTLADVAGEDIHLLSEQEICFFQGQHERKLRPRYRLKPAERSRYMGIGTRNRSGYLAVTS